uniref:Uncharacterized protein n=1 Tax=Hanusia phi TaxID=3032 RepID=A0A7S0NFG7_9CRYP
MYSSTSSGRTCPSVSFSSTARNSERLIFRSPSSSSCVKACLISATTSQSFIFLVIIWQNCNKSTLPPTSLTISCRSASVYTHPKLLKQALSSRTSKKPLLEASNRSKICRFLSLPVSVSIS